MKRYLVFGLILLTPFFVLAEGFDRDLQFGMQNDSNVTKLQELLTDEGLYSGPISGNFFSLTLKAVKKFQTREGIKPASGYFGLKTRTKANTILAANLNESKDEASIENTAPPVSVSTTPIKTENTKSNVMNSVMDQIAALQKQLDLLLKKNPIPPAQITTVPNQAPVVTQPVPQNISPISSPTDNITNTLPQAYIPPVYNTQTQNTQTAHDVKPTLSLTIQNSSEIIGSFNTASKYGKIGAIILTSKNGPIVLRSLTFHVAMSTSTIFYLDSAELHDVFGNVVAGPLNPQPNNAITFDDSENIDKHILLPTNGSITIYIWGRIAPIKQGNLSELLKSENLQLSTNPATDWIISAETPVDLQNSIIDLQKVTFN